MLGKEEVGIICMAWRILYAETVTARVNGRHLNLPRAYAKLVQLIVSRVKAYGAKWRRWYLGQRHWSATKAKTIPKEHWEYKLITSDSEGIYKISETLLKEYEKHIDELKEPRGVG
jgi:hypothetical protein